MMDHVDAIMQVMEAAFDPAYGEAWNRRQVSDALAMPHTRYLLANAKGANPALPEDAVGFTMSRQAADEEELLLIAVAPNARGRGVGAALMRRFIACAGERGVNRLFLEMRDGNPAYALYEHHGFLPVGRRRDYYRSGSEGPFDAVTFSRAID
ncbi:ribosomal protein S18-alanine N-acetyltransferase [Alteraurantiacibacter aquimixticola]|uniref:[Ribosomal protein bS18]-alanine N-acetyltransferase n=1 Tax=Alteraurantiacibacter aquimixticola TaxID=2489173 RepID=A0A4T3F0Q1_9SPHN|nr:ribosomal protein S18-alanine N-acetyltransferase [Alteraurantiacibacter aquimixticola]TIX50514.1 ribosomal-protein-alanine N-acetyltransferase [Alteraurantiacibacter aquimixticola]